MLVRQLTAEAWKLERIGRAEFSLLRHLQDGQIIRFLGSLSESELVYVKSAYKNDLHDQIKQQRQQIVDQIRERDEPNPPFEYIEPEALAFELDADEKRDVDARLVRILEVENTILAGLVPKTESAPLACLDRERRAAARAYLSYVAKLRELQEERLTVNLIPVPVAEKEAAPSTHTGLTRPLTPKKPGGQSHQKPGNEGTEKGAFIARTRRQIRNDPGGQRIDAAPES